MCPNLRLNELMEDIILINQLECIEKVEEEDEE